MAGIDPGIEGIVDLAQGGSNVISDGGFKPEFDDGSPGEARHFAGTVATVTIFCVLATEMVTHTFNDAPDTADGRLTTVAVRFAELVMDGELQIDRAGQWIVDELFLEEDSNRRSR